MQYPSKLFTKILISAILLVNICQAQDSRLDSLEQLVDNHQKEDSLRVDLLLELASIYTSFDINASIPLIDEALSISEKINYTRGTGASYNAKSTYHILNGSLDVALEISLNAEEILKSVNDKKNLIVSYSNLARIYGATGKYEKALEIQLKNVELIRDDPPTSKKASYYFYAAKSFQELKNYHEAEKYFLAALKISEKANFPTGVAIAEGSLGTLNWQLGKYKTAVEYLNKTLEFAKKTNQQANEAGAYLSLAKCYAGLGNYKLALKNNAESIKIYKAQNNIRILKDAYQNHYTYLEGLSMHEQANKYLKMYTELKDSLFSYDKTKIIEELQTKYETEKKEAEIATLSNQATIQELELKQKNTVIVVGLVLLLLVSIGTYLFIRQRNLKTQKTQMELEQRFLRSQLNPHFISNALMAVQNFMLKNQAETAALYLSKFAKLMRETLENSRKEFVLLEDEIKMISNFMDIHKMRMNDAFEYQIEVEEDIDPESDCIPPMFIQPFVENSIEHGIPNTVGNGRIKIKFAKDGEYIDIVVEDNGGGFSKERTEETDHTSLSTTIIQERMDIFNKALKRKIKVGTEDVIGDDHQIQGSRVELKVPFRYI